MKPNESQRYLSTPHVAARLGINPAKVRLFIESGELEAIDISVHQGAGRPRWRVKREALEAFEKARSSSMTSKPVTKGRRRSATPSYYD